MAHAPIKVTIPFLGGRARRYAYAEVTIAAGAAFVVFADVYRFSRRAFPWTLIYATTTAAAINNAWGNTSNGTGNPQPARLCAQDYTRPAGVVSSLYNVVLHNTWEDPGGNPIPCDAQVMHYEVEP